MTLLLHVLPITQDWTLFPSVSARLRQILGHESVISVLILAVLVLEKNKIEILPVLARVECVFVNFGYVDFNGLHGVCVVWFR